VNPLLDLDMAGEGSLCSFRSGTHRRVRSARAPRDAHGSWPKRQSRFPQGTRSEISAHAEMHRPAFFGLESCGGSQSKSVGAASHQSLPSSRSDGRGQFAIPAPQGRKNNRKGHKTEQVNPAGPRGSTRIVRYPASICYDGHTNFHTFSTTPREASADFP